MFAVISVGSKAVLEPLPAQSKTVRRSRDIATLLFENSGDNLLSDSIERGAQIDDLPDLRDQSIYLAVMLSKGEDTGKGKYALIEVPTMVLPRFLILPMHGKEKYVILLDDVIRHGLGEIFHVFGFNSFEAYTVKLTRDAELDLDDDLVRL